MFPLLILALFTTAIKINDLCLIQVFYGVSSAGNSAERRNLRSYGEMDFFERISPSKNAVGKRRKL